MGYQSQAPNMLAVVEELARKYPRAFADSHRPERGDRAWLFGRIVASTLHYQYDKRWGGNGKRGNVNDESMDAVAWREPRSPAGGVDIIDVVAHAGETDPRKPQPAPAWIDQTQATVDHGTIGAWVQPRPLAEILAAAGEIPADAGPTPEPDTPDRPENPTPTLPAELATVLHQILGRLETVEAQVRAGNGGIGEAVRLINGNFGQLFHTALANERKRIFGVLDEGGVTHPGVAEEAARLTVQALYDRNEQPGGALRVKVDAGNLGGLFGGRRGLVSEPPTTEEGPQEG